MKEPPRRRGRPPKAAEPDARVPLGLRVTGDVKQRIEAMALAGGRTQSQEAERLILIGLEFEDRAALLRAVEATENKLVDMLAAKVAAALDKGRGRE